MRATLSLLKYFKGTIPVCFCKPDDMGNISKMGIDEYKIELSGILLEELMERYGRENVKIVTRPGDVPKCAH